MSVIFRYLFLSVLVLVAEFLGLETCTQGLLYSCMSPSGKENEPPKAVAADLSDDLDVSSVAPTPSLHVDLFSEMQRQIKANHL